MFPPNLADKKRLDPNEEKLALLQKLNRDTHKMVSIEDVNKVSHHHYVRGMVIKLVFICCEPIMKADMGVGITTVR
jgi:predicted RNA polymerase sigma factor